MAAVAPLPALPIVTDQAYRANAQVTLKVKEAHLSFSGDDFTVVDVQNGYQLFRLDAKLASLRERRVLLDAAGRPTAGLRRKLVSMSGAWELFRGGDFAEGQKLATIKKKLLTLKPQVHVYLCRNGVDDEAPTFVAKGNFLAKSFEVSARAPDGREAPVALIKKESRFSSAAAFLKAAVSDADAYFLTAQPGADLALLVALCITIDELFQEQKK